MVVAVVKGIPGQLNPTITSLQKSLSAVDRHLLNKITGQPRDKPDLELYRNEAMMLKQKLTKLNRKLSKPMSAGGDSQAMDSQLMDSVAPRPPMESQAQWMTHQLVHHDFMGLLFVFFCFVVLYFVNIES